MEKQCSKCKQVKSLDSYYKDKEKKDGLASSCKACVYKQQSNFRKKPKEFITKTHKKCCSCKEELSVDNFIKDKTRGDGYSGMCKKCDRETATLYRENNKEKIEKYENSEARIKQRKEYSKIYHKVNSDILTAKKREYIQNNRDRFNERNRKRYRENPQFRISQSIRTRIRKTVTGEYKYSSSLDLLGCTVEELKLHLEKQFLPTMTWENYGTLWHIDHILPCASFDLTILENQRKCFHYTNLQPLFAVTTIIDGIEYIGNLQKSDNII